MSTAAWIIAGWCVIPTTVVVVFGYLANRAKTKARQRSAARRAELAEIPSPNRGALRSRNGSLGADDRRAA